MAAATPTDRIRFSALCRGALTGIPTTPRLLKGLWGLATLKPDSPRSIGRLLQTHAERRPDAPALRFEDEVWTYAQFNAWANRLADVLRQQGIGAGDVVAVLVENRPLVLAAVAGIVKLGAVAAMVNHQQRGEVLRHSLKLTSPKLALVGAECAEAWQSVGGDTPPVLWDGADAPNGALQLAPLLAQAQDGEPAELESVSANQPCFYIFTSGTTGLPKASRMTHYRWLRGMAGLGQMGLRLGPDDVLYCCLPLYHNNALTVSWGAVLGAGATFALGRRFSASRFWDEIRRHRATAFCYIGELCRYLLNRPATPGDRDHSVHSVIGNGLRPEIWAAFQDRFGIRNVSEFYGASESNLAFVNGFNVQRTAGFCPMPFAVVAFDADAEQPRRGADGYMRKVATGDTGLLITEVSEKTPFDGYTDPQASEAKLLRNVFAPGDCWFNTGDLVRDQGFRHIQFVDRVGDTFRWKGENVATTEVEAALGAFPGIEQAVVYGVAIPDADGRAGMAALTLSGSLDGAALSRHLADALPAYAIPLFLRLRAEQETTATFKYRKVDLKREGFDPARVVDPLWVRWTPEAYVPLTADHVAAIHRGEWRG
ncbi:long-chain-acyl-CoA synthetase [Flagellatimonas centrodinii]|uniref:long-chain-acyl-CoA synthetase n=1 Tax=Flagellatimonas centrodinii TaxID=2806210 RepID=UPI001FED5785|nr:long-chain-acyl-CoA synthetase [Flagellatimonas centrodinii]ULQ46428.1 long-chain-acyl-CoA synthetase [Flagellatimonas centrodinii]